MGDWTNYSISEWSSACHKLAVDKGWYNGINLERLRDGNPPVDYVLSRLALVHSEVSEAVESVRLGEPYRFVSKAKKPEGLAIELADVVIRCMDLAESLGINLEAAIAEKYAYNRTRPERHGGKLA